METCSPVGGAVWGCLGGMLLLEKVCHWGHTLRFQRHRPFPVHHLLDDEICLDFRCELSVVPDAVSVACFHASLP